ncbi:hypothetical protein [Paraburkholderia sp.]|uniref:hypothetical protein n=1 Tax=Paraburkholderia sp. TaxID=1926495 RepID=UPI0025DAE64C|nr:hypothetical protein [Paraburkholderia sp.]
MREVATGGRALDPVAANNTCDGARPGRLIYRLKKYLQNGVDEYRSDLHNLVSLLLTQRRRKRRVVKSFTAVSANDL